MDVAAEGVELYVYDGTKPSAGGSESGCNALFTLTATEGSTVSAPIWSTGISFRAGTPTWARMRKPSGVYLADYTVVPGSPSAGQLQIPTVIEGRRMTGSLSGALGAGGFTGTISQGSTEIEDPDLPRYGANFDFLTSYFDDAPTVTVNVGETLAAAVSRVVAANPGAIKFQVLVPAGRTYIAEVLPNYGTGKWVQIKFDYALPATSVGDPLVSGSLGQRWTPTLSSAANAPIVYTSDFESAITFASGAEGYQIRGLRCEKGSTFEWVSPFIDLGGNFNVAAIADHPGRISLRQVCIVGLQGGQSRRFGIRTNAWLWEVVDCWVEHINFGSVTYAGQSQPISQFQGVGKGRVWNCFLWRATEAYAWGGAGHHPEFYAAQINPGDITIRFCHFYAPFSVKQTPANDNPLAEGCANSGEMKVNRRVLISDIILENTWNDLQNGYLGVFWSADPASWSQFSDLTFQWIWSKNNNSGFSLANAYPFVNDFDRPMHPRRMKIDQILCTGFQSPVTYSPGGGTFGRILMMGNHIPHIKISHVTCLNGGVAVALDATDGTLHKNLHITNSILEGYYFCINDGVANGPTGWSSAVDADSRYSNNVNLDRTGFSNVINPDATNVTETTLAALGFGDASKVEGSDTVWDDLHLCASATYPTKSCDAVTLKSRLTNVPFYSTGNPEPPPTPALTTLVLSPVTANLTVGQQTQLTVAGFDQFGASFDPGPLVAHSTVTAVANASAVGLTVTVNAIGNGATSVTVTAQGVTSNACAVTVVGGVTPPDPSGVLASLTLGPNAVSGNANGTAQIGIVAKDTNGAEMATPTLTFHSSNSATAIIDHVAGGGSKLVVDLEQAGMAQVWVSNGSIESNKVLVMVMDPGGGKGHHRP